MGDAKLQRLRRQVAMGDTQALEALDAALCRIEGHDWRDLHWCDSKWATVELCHRCLATRAERLNVRDVPDIFTVWSGKHFRKPEAHRIRHAVHPSSTTFKARGKYRNYRITTVCKAVVDDLVRPSLILKDCGKSVSCQNCLKALDKVDQEFLTQLSAVSMHVYAELRGSLERPKALKKATVCKNEK